MMEEWLRCFWHRHLCTCRWQWLAQADRAQVEAFHRSGLDLDVWAHLSEESRAVFVEVAVAATMEDAGAVGLAVTSPTSRVLMSTPQEAVEDVADDLFLDSWAASLMWRASRGGR